RRAITAKVPLELPPHRKFAVAMDCHELGSLYWQPSARCNSLYPGSFKMIGRAAFDNCSKLPIRDFHRPKHAAVRGVANDWVMRGDWLPFRRSRPSVPELDRASWPVDRAIRKPASRRGHLPVIL